MNRDELMDLIKLLEGHDVGVVIADSRDGTMGALSEMLTDVLGSMCGEYMMSDAHERELVEDVAALAKKWMNYETYPADPSKRQKRDTDPEMPEGAQVTFTVIARGLSLLHMITSATSGAAFMSAPRVMEQPIGGLYQKCVHHSLELGLARSLEFKKEKKAERRAHREAKARESHPAAAKEPAQEESARPPAPTEEDALKN